MEDVTNQEGAKKTVKTASIPRADSDFGKVTKDVSDAWTANNWLTLHYTTAAVFAAKSASFNTLLAARQSEGGTRPQVTSSLQKLNEEIDGSVKIVKNYIEEKFRTERPESYYPAFGIAFVNKHYTFPQDQSNREDALTLMLSGLRTHDMEDRIYGRTYWTDIRDRYIALVVQGRALDGGISDKVGDKNVLKKELKIVLNSIVNVIKGNFPDTYKQELRKWGLQKEKY